MKINRPLDEIISNQTKIQILRTLFKYPGNFSGRHTARLCNLPQKTVQRHLDTLVTNNIINVQQFGRSKVFSLNKKNILYRPLSQLFKAEEKVLPKLENLIKETIAQSKYLRNCLAHASIFGSVVEGREAPESDIDLLLLFKDHLDENKAEEQLERVANTITTISGNHLHWYVKSVKNLNKINRQLLRNAKKNSRLLYGKKIEEL